MQMPPDEILEWESLEHGNHAGRVIWQDEGTHVIACAGCGFNHVVPLPSAEVQKQFYEEDFYQSEKKTYLTSSAADIEWKTVEFSRRFETVEKALKAQGKVKRVLDIGCGPGEFLMVGQSRGWEAIGVEPSPVASEYAREQGVHVLTGFFDVDMAQTLGEFDFIHMSEVLEHISNPVELLALAKSLLKPNGIICVSVPNDFSPTQDVLVKTGSHTPWWVVPDHHLNYFNFETLSILIENSGFSAFEKTTNFPMELFLLMGQDYTKDSALGSQFHGWRKSFDISLYEKNPELLEAFYRSVAGAGIGRLAIVFGQAK